MNKTDNSFTSSEKALLSSLIGRKLKCIDAGIVARGDMAWERVRLHLEGLDVDLVNQLSDVVMDEFGSTDEFSALRVLGATGEKLVISGLGADVVTQEIDERIRGVDVVEDALRVFGDGAEVASVVYDQAVVLHLEKDCIVLDKETWFEDTIAIKRGVDFHELVFDDAANLAGDPDEDPTTAYQYSSHIRSL